jgi:hypothetical protein
MGDLVGKITARFQSAKSRVFDSNGHPQIQEIQEIQEIDNKGVSIR